MGAQILSFLLCGIVLIFLLARGERFRDALGFIVVLLVASIPIAIEIVRCRPTCWTQSFLCWVLGVELGLLLVASFHCHRGRYVGLRCFESNSDC